MMRDICGLPRDTHADGTTFKIWPHDLPQLCAVSPSLFPEPQDWPSQKHISGWLFMSSASDYAPPEGLLDFLKHEPVYIGFGSMKVEGVPLDYTEAVKWFRLAAEEGSTLAQLRLGFAYLLGEGVIQDNVYAHMWFNIGASLGNEMATENRNLVANTMTNEDISKAQQLARECVAKNYKGC